MFRFIDSQRLEIAMFRREQERFERDIEGRNPA